MDQISPGTQCCIRQVEANRALKIRLYDMGLLPGTVVQVVKLAPTGDPMALFLRGYTLTLGRAEAQKITVDQN